MAKNNIMIRTRLEHLLAKIAGRKVDDEPIDLSKLTPSFASGTEEKLMLEIADRLDSMSGGDITIPNATATKAGAVKMAANVAEAAGANPTAAEFKALIDALIAAGVMAPAAK